MSNSERPHRRRNPLTGQWVLVSPHRTQRPWQGNYEAELVTDGVIHDPNCFLCPGNDRANGHVNPDYADTLVFDNDYPALLENEGFIDPPNLSDRLFQSELVAGTCRVVCFSPRHDLTLARMSEIGVLRVIDVWAQETSELGAQYQWVQIFENRGATMGCSNAHPHGQIWASNHLPDIPAAEDKLQAEYKAESDGVLLLDYLQREITAGERIVVDTDHWLAVVPYWATWPFETLLMPKRHVQRLPDLTDGERIDLAHAMKQLLTRYDNLFETSFPYSMGWHGAPFVDRDTHHWQLHAHFFPPLLRSAAVKKFMVGYEMMAESQRDIAPEQAAERLRAVPVDHYGDE